MPTAELIPSPSAYDAQNHSLCHLSGLIKNIYAIQSIAELLNAVRSLALWRGFCREGSRGRGLSCTRQSTGTEYIYTDRLMCEYDEVSYHVHRSALVSYLRMTRNDVTASLKSYSHLRHDTNLLRESVDGTSSNDFRKAQYTPPTRRNCFVASRRVGVGGVYMNSQLAHDDCRRIRRCERSRWQ